MSTEVVAITIAAASLLVTLGSGLLTGFAWIIRRMDEGFARVYGDMGASFERANARMDEGFARAHARMDELHDELVGVRADVAEVRAEVMEVKISVARLEGPTRPQLIVPR